MAVAFFAVVAGAFLAGALATTEDFAATTSSAAYLLKRAFNLFLFFQALAFGNFFPTKQCCFEDDLLDITVNLKSTKFIYFIFRKSKKNFKKLARMLIFKI